MIKVEKWNVYNFVNAMRGMRNPLESYDKNDTEEFIAINNSMFGGEFQGYEKCSDVRTHVRLGNGGEYHGYPVVNIGDNDLELAQKLIKAGKDHSKFMRQIMVSMDLTLPLYVWKEFDTYKIGTVANSCSTMHTLSKKPIDLENFSIDGGVKYSPETLIAFNDFVNKIDEIREKFLETKDSVIWRAMIQMLPESWNQKRTITLNYEVLRKMYFARRNHKLIEWIEFCKWIESLPFADKLICYE